jgi:radical SAM superfamily enzyme YgiQ (UPF0313 family)
MRVLLVVPGISGGKLRLCPNLGIAAVAALTPDSISVEVCDENAERLDFDRECDLVGITAMTPSALRAYEVADAFRERGKTVVLGGFHPSFLPDEAIQHCDSVVIGEAEGIWPRLLGDFAAGRLQKLYRQETFSDLRGQPIPRRDLFRRGVYKLPSTIETGRGCPFACNFCSVTTFHGKKYRFRPVQEVITEVETLRGKLMFIVDDNVIGSPAHAKELFRALIPCDKRWIGQASLNLGRDPELLDLAARSGCIGLFMGFESLSPESLAEAGKTHNCVQRYEEDVKRIRDRGISIHGAFIFGFDHDDEDVFDRTVDFVKKNKLDSASFSTLTPFPGTPTYRKLDSEGRLVTQDWSRYGGAVFTPRLMSREALDAGCRRAWRECYSWKSVFGRLATRKQYWHIHVLLNLGYKLSLS